jgi:hypothetical protein
MHAIADRGKNPKIPEDKKFQTFCKPSGRLVKSSNLTCKSISEETQMGRRHSLYRSGLNQKSHLFRCKFAGEKSQGIKPKRGNF